MEPASSRNTKRWFGLATLRLSRVAAFRPERGTPLDAAASFGRPSFIGPRDELCIHEWLDLGSTINFANLGGQDPCGPDRRVGSIELGGVPAERAGWETEHGVRIGMALQDVRELLTDGPVMRLGGSRETFRRSPKRLAVAGTSAASSPGTTSSR